MNKKLGLKERSDLLSLTSRERDTNWCSFKEARDLAKREQGDAIHPSNISDPRSELFQMTFEMTPEEVTKRYGKLFCKGFFTLVDEKNGKALIIEECSAKGPVEWDMCNRKRAGGALEHIRVEGTTLIMDTIIGEREVHFGPASKDLGGQGLKALIVDGDTVKTTWVGLAGASVGIGACLPQAPQAIRTTYPDDPKNRRCA